MPLRRIAILVPLAFFAIYCPCFGNDRSKDVLAEQSKIEETVRRYITSIGGYIEGDLITRSQMEDVQRYLRRTHGHSAATHPRILRRILVDESRLVQLFYKKDGAEILRAAASRNGGYEVFDRISRTTAGHTRLVEAVEQNDEARLDQLADEEFQKQAAAKGKNNDARVKRTKRTRIYTIEDYLTAFRIATKIADEPN